MSNKVYVGDVGTVIALDTGVDISSHSSLSIKVKKPDGSTETWAASLEATTEVVYTTAPGDIDQAGTYKLQAFVTLPDWSGHTETVELKVYAPFY